MTDTRLRRWIAITLIIWTLACFFSGVMVGRYMAKEVEWVEMK